MLAPTKEKVDLHERARNKLPSRSEKETDSAWASTFRRVSVSAVMCHVIVTSQLVSSIFSGI